jgi:hypothetical protein
MDTNLIGSRLGKDEPLAADITPVPTSRVRFNSFAGRRIRAYRQAA